MKVEIFSLCDFASVDASGKQNLIGVFDTIFAREAPIIYGLCALAVRIRFDRIEEGPKKVRASFVDEDGNSVLPVMETQVRVQPAPQAPSAIAQVVLIMSQIKLPNFGEYSIDLAVDGRHEASIPLYVRKMQTPPPQAHDPIAKTSLGAGIAS